RVELPAGLAVFVEPAGVVHADVLAGVRFVAGARRDVVVLQPGGGGLVGHRGSLRGWVVVELEGGASGAGPLMGSCAAAGSGSTCPSGRRPCVAHRRRTDRPARSPATGRHCASPRPGTSRGPCASS